MICEKQTKYKRIHHSSCVSDLQFKHLIGILNSGLGGQLILLIYVSFLLFF